MSRLKGERKALLVRDGSTESVDDYEIKTYSDNIVLTSTTQKEEGKGGKPKPNSEINGNTGEDRNYTSLNDFLAKAEAAYDLGTDNNGENGIDLPKAIRLNGENASSAPDYSVAIGEGSKAYYCGVSVGKNTSAGNIALAVGTDLSVVGENSASFGNNNQITNDGTQSMAIGTNNTVDSKNSFICGNNNNIQIGEYIKIYKGGIAKVSSGYYYSISPNNIVGSKLLLRPSQDNMYPYYTDNPFYDAYLYMKENNIEKASATLCLNSTVNEFLVKVAPVLNESFFGFYIENFSDELVSYINSIEETGSYGKTFTWVQISIEVGEEFSPTSYGESGCAIGINNTVKGNSSIAMGSNIIADGENKVAVGNFNNPNRDNIFEVGCGTSEEDRKNALNIDKNGILRTRNLVIRGFGPQFGGIPQKREILLKEYLPYVTYQYAIHDSPNISVDLPSDPFILYMTVIRKPYLIKNGGGPPTMYKWTIIENYIIERGYAIDDQFESADERYRLIPLSKSHSDSFCLASIDNENGTINFDQSAYVIFKPNEIPLNYEPYD